MTLAKYIGVPYQPRGVFPDAADCYTLIKAYAFLELGEHWPDFMYDIDTYRLEEATAHIIREMELGHRWTKLTQPERGAMLIFLLNGFPTHCGIYLGDGDFLHTLAGRTSCLERLETWQKSLVGIFRWAGE